MLSIEFFKVFHILANSNHENLFGIFLEDFQLVIILGILTLSLGIIGRNYRALLAQSMLYLAFWLQFCLYKVFFVFFIDNQILLWVNASVYLLLLVIQVGALILTLLELVDWIKKETLE